MTTRDASGRFAAVRPIRSVEWIEPGADPTLTHEQSIWVKSAIDHIVAGLEPLPELEPTTGLCELRIEVPFEGTTLRYICGRPAGHRGEPCAPLDSEGRNVLEELEAAEEREQPSPKHGGQ